jgi:hypothetical protein
VGWSLEAKLGLHVSAIVGWILGWLIALAIDLRGVRRPDVVRLAARMVLMTMASASLLVAGLGAAKAVTVGGLTPSVAFAVLFFIALGVATFWSACRLSRC